MPTPADELEQLNDLETAVDLIDDLTWEDDEREDLIGMEVEAFPMAGRSTAGSRLTLHGHGGVLEILGTSLGVSHDPSTGHPPSFALGDSGRLTFEPGGQIEISSSPRRDTASLGAVVESCRKVIEEALADVPAGLVCLGIDPWHGVEEVPLQQRHGRYVAMDRYFSTRWPAGRVMMRNTCSLQVNLESGAGRLREERWLVANLMSPVLGAIFSTSPGADGAASRRAKVWQEIDPSRTGYPSWPGVDPVDPLGDARRRALTSLVMFVVREGSFIPLDPGLTFERWVRDGHPQFGRPTRGDLSRHLSTLFPEVRPRRGTLELRAIDSLPRRWWMVPAVISAAILYDDEARGRAIDLLSAFAGRLEDSWRISAEDGLGNPKLADVARTLFGLALEAVGRSSRFDSGDVAATGEFFECFTGRGQTPGDELRSLIFGGGDTLERARLELARVVCA